MDILRPFNGVYRNIKDLNDKRRYVLHDFGEGYYPVLMQVDIPCAGPLHQEHFMQEKHGGYSREFIPMVVIKCWRSNQYC